MDILELVNSNIKYVYILLGIIVFVLLIVLKSNAKSINKKVNNTKLYISSINNEINSANKSVEKINYTTENTLPLVVFLAISFSVLVSSFKNNKKNKKGFIKNTINQYGKVNKILDLTHTGGYVKTVASEIKKMI